MFARLAGSRSPGPDPSTEPSSLRTPAAAECRWPGRPTRAIGGKHGRWRAFAIELAAIVAFVVFLNRLFAFPFSPPIAAKGKSDDFLPAGALFVCMLLGMISQFLYRRFERPQRLRPNWDWGMFIAPVFASPIVFIPLPAAFQNAIIDLKELTAPRLMIFFVAYQNGLLLEGVLRPQATPGRPEEAMKWPLTVAASTLLAACLSAQQDWPASVTRTTLPDRSAALRSHHQRTTSLLVATTAGDLQLEARQGLALPPQRSIADRRQPYESLRPRELALVETDVTELRNFPLTGGAFDTVLEARNAIVTRSLIERYMANEFAATGPILNSEDRLLFYYSGHGTDQAGTIGYLQFSKARDNDFYGDHIRKGVRRRVRVRVNGSIANSATVKRRTKLQVFILVTSTT